MSRFRTAILSLSLVIAAPLVAAQETDIKDQISVELNAVETTEDACKLTFMITNGLEALVDKIIYEAVLFDTEGQVDRLTLFDFGQPFDYSAFQSLFDRVLAAMKRNHTALEYKSRIRKLKAAVPDIILSSDFIIIFKIARNISIRRDCYPKKVPSHIHRCSGK